MSFTVYLRPVRTRRRSGVASTRRNERRRQFRFKAQTRTYSLHSPLLPPPSRANRRYGRDRFRVVGRRDRDPFREARKNNTRSARRVDECFLFPLELPSIPQGSCIARDVKGAERGFPFAGSVQSEGNSAVRGTSRRVHTSEANEERALRPSNMH